MREEQDRDHGDCTAAAAVGEGDNRPQVGNMAEVEGQAAVGVEEVGA